MRDKTPYIRFNFWMVLTVCCVLGTFNFAWAADPAVVAADGASEEQVATRLPDAKTTAKAVNGSIFSRFFIKEPTVITQQEYIRSGYILKDPKPHGSIIRNYDFWNTVSQGEYVYIDFGTNKGAKPGDKFLIYLLNENFGQGFDYHRSVTHPVLDKDDKDEKDYIASDIWDLDHNLDFGIWRKSVDYFDKMTKHQGKKEGEMVRVVGVLEVVEPEADMSRAIIADMWDEIPRGSFLAPYPKSIPAMLPLNHQAKAKNLSGYIIDNREGYQLNGENDFVYIDIGTIDQVEPGDRFYVIASSHYDKNKNKSLEPIIDEILDRDDKRTLMDRRVGEILVIAAEQETATAIVVDSEESILPGHRIQSKR